MCASGGGYVCERVSMCAWMLRHASITRVLCAHTHQPHADAEVRAGPCMPLRCTCDKKGKGERRVGKSMQRHMDKQGQQYQYHRCHKCVYVYVCVCPLELRDTWTSKASNINTTGATNVLSMCPLLCRHVCVCMCSLCVCVCVLCVCVGVY